MRRNRNAGIVAVVRGSTIIKGLLSIFILLLFIFSVSGIMTSLKPEYRIASQSVNTVANQFSGKVLFSLLANENHHFFQALPEGKNSPDISGKMLKLSANISLDDPRSLLGRELPGFSIFDSEILVAGEGTNYTNMPYESAPPVDVLKAEREAALQNLEQLEEPQKTEQPVPAPANSTNGRKVVHIYHSHNRESFLPYLKGVTDPNRASHSKVNITRLGDRLAADLMERGIGASVDKTDIQGNLNKKGLKYSKSYQESRGLVQAAMAANKDLDYFIDIHRDSHRKDKTTIKINGRTYAKIAFVIGGKNAQYQKNFALAKKLHTAIENKYPGLSRGIIKHNKTGYNSVYNQDLSEKAMLVEVGGVDNTFEEMYVTLDAFAEVFSEYYWDAKAVSAPAAGKEAQ
ncbi:stage II sporulation protein P [Bacillus sp. M6-12]|uniref:stage II sporulation protein P n=1 Tax=Bacillus sp. M6-12 TaxID=2054166 RepID=UPI000C77BE07|nr:stage II sporulation protein P [Bacillus sp. M6-12]PLS15173.1 stage II sporulation protein P [Bacillus sp. M6-12]